MANVSIEELEVLGVSITENQARTLSIFTLIFLWVSHLVNWLGDLFSLGRWNSAMKSKRVETMWDGGGKIKGRLEFILEEFERALDEEIKPKESVNVTYIKNELEEIKASLWWHERAAIFYVLVWSFFVPTLLTLSAGFVILHG